VLGRAVLASALALLALPATATAASATPVDRPVASLRSAPASFAIGHLFAGDNVDVVARSGRWVYGATGGRCAWMMDQGLRLQGTSQAGCPSPRTLDPALLFAPHSYQLGCGEGCVYPARAVDCADRTVYANYDAVTGTFADPAGRERVGRGTRGRTVPRYPGVRHGYAGWGVRYVTRDGAATLIKDTGRRRGPTWMSVHSECVERLSLIVRPARIGTFPCAPSCGAAASSGCECSGQLRRGREASGRPRRSSVVDLLRLRPPPVSRQLSTSSAYGRVTRQPSAPGAYRRLTRRADAATASISLFPRSRLSVLETQ
jgi:hypothetical protein